MKNIPIPSRNTYIKKLIEKTESVIKRIRWKAFFFEQNKDKNKTNRDSDKDDSNSAILITTSALNQENVHRKTRISTTSKLTYTT